MATAAILETQGKMATVKPQAIAGVCYDSESIVMMVWPSVACTAPGRILGMLCDSIPLSINGVKLSYLLFGLPVGLLALPIYLGLKVVGERYVLTTRSVQRWAALGSRLISGVQLTDIVAIEIDEQPGQRFHHAADLKLLNATGDTILRLPGVSRPEVFRRTILETRDARMQVGASLATIQGRSKG